jgi:hypothetical protein
MTHAEALDRIGEIHRHVARGEVYRGYRPLPVAASGLVGFAAAGLQSRLGLAPDPIAYVVFWAVVAAIAAALGSIEIVVNYLWRETPFERRKTRLVVGQFVPSVFAGAVVTVALVRLEPGLVRLLPGLWAALFGVAIFAARPYLPRATGWVGLAYLGAGAWLLVTAGAGTPSPWAVGGVFGTGQMLAALVLYGNLERDESWAELTQGRASAPPEP